MFSKIKDYVSGYQASGPIEFIVAGLGNPGKEYENTRHNAGFMAIDDLAKLHDVPMKKLQFRSLCGDTVIAGKRVLLMKPSMYMNRSGESVREAMQFYKIPIEHVLVICDDTALEVGKLRIRRKGSDGGQKGLANIIELTRSDHFPRLRIGIGSKPHPDMDLADWVLSRFSPADLKTLEALYPKIRQGVELIIENKIDEAMSQLN